MLETKCLDIRIHSNCGSIYGETLIEYLTENKGEFCITALERGIWEEEGQIKEKTLRVYTLFPETLMKYLHATYQAGDDNQYATRFSEREIKEVKEYVPDPDGFINF